MTTAQLRTQNSKLKTPAAASAAPAPAEGAPADELQLVPLRCIAPNPLNPRRTFDEATLEQLAVSIRAKGVLQPVLLRPHPQAGARANASFQLVAGERRVRAAALAGLAVIPAIVRRLNDQQCLEVMVVENEQRADVGPMEKADGYAKLLELGATVEDLATRVGRSVSTIRTLLKLRGLPESARAAVDAGQLLPAIAGLIARVPGEAARAKLTRAVLDGNRIYDHKLRKNVPVPLTFRDVRELIGTSYSVELGKAPFDRKSLDLVPAAGSCTDCPKRVGNLQKDDPEGYAGVRADVCTDPPCFASKRNAWRQRLIAEAKGKGHQFLGKQKSACLFGWSETLGYHAPYVDLAATASSAHGRAANARTYGQLLEEHLDDKEIAIAFDRSGDVHRLVDKARAAELLKAHHGIGSAADKRVPLSPADKRAEAKARAEQKLTREVDRALLAEIARRGEHLFAPLKARGGAINAVLRFLAANAAIQSQARDEVYARRACKGNFLEKQQALAKIIAAAEAPALMGLLLELKVGAVLLGWTEGRADAPAITQSLDLPSRKEVEKEVRERRKRESESKGKPKAARAGKGA